MYIKSDTLIIGDFKTPLSPMERKTIQKLIREVRERTNITTQIDITDVYRTFYPNTED